MAFTISSDQNTGRWDITQAQADKLLGFLQANSDIKNKTLGALVGNFSAQNVDFSYTYAPNPGTLNVVIVKKHGLSGMASNPKVFSILDKDINQAIA
jgi:hypothetical protein